MSYHLYHTDALVLGSAPSGEGSKLIVLFTRDLGLITASAQSVREERSKLRYGLQDFSYSDVTLVRGKEFWRLTNAALYENMLDQGEERKAVQMVSRISKLLRRLLAGEEKNEPLFVSVLEGLQFVKTMRTTESMPCPAVASREGGRKYEQEAHTTPSIPLLIQGGEDALAGVEIVLVLRILHLLGYLAPRNEFNPFLTHADMWDEEVVSKALLFRSLAISEINNSLKESQL